MIRLTHSPEDVAHVVSMAVTFNDTYYDMPADYEHTRKWVDFIVDRGVIFKDDYGFIGGMLVPDPLRPRWALVEFGWYSTRNGAALLQRFIDYGREVGAGEVRMTTLSTTPAGVDTYLRRKGFALIEKSHRLLL